MKPLCYRTSCRAPPAAERACRGQGPRMTEILGQGPRRRPGVPAPLGAHRRPHYVQVRVSGLQDASGGFPGRRSVFSLRFVSV